MMEWIARFFGDYALQVIVQGASQLELLITALLISIPLRRRLRFGLLLPLGLLLCLGILVACAVARTHTDAPFIQIVILSTRYASTLLLMWLCWEEDFFLILKNWCASIAMVEIANSVFCLALAAAGRPTVGNMSFFPEAAYPRDWLIFFGFRIMVYIAVLWPLRRISRDPTDRIARRNIALLTLFCMFALSIIISITNRYSQESQGLNLIINVFIIIVGVFILLLRSGITLQSQARTELNLMESMMHEQRKQYDLNRESLNAINMLCHDLKHRLADLAGKLTDEEVRSLQEAMALYDSTIRTGCEVLDVVMYSYQLTCQQEGIRLSCLADGRLLSFMRTRHLYALFTNALQNAVEAVRKLEDPEKKNIGVTVEPMGNQVEISVINYFNGTLSADAGRLGTTKADRNHHGLGLQSMQYILSEYGGTLETDVQGEVFSLRIRIPLPEGTTGQQP